MLPPPPPNQLKRKSRVPAGSAQSSRVSRSESAGGLCATLKAIVLLRLVPYSTGTGRVIARTGARGDSTALLRVLPVQQRSPEDSVEGQGGVGGMTYLDAFRELLHDSQTHRCVGHLGGPPGGRELSVPRDNCFRKTAQMPRVTGQGSDGETETISRIEAMKINLASVHRRPTSLC